MFGWCLCGVVYIDVNIIKHSRFFYNIRIVRTVNILLKYHILKPINYAYINMYKLNKTS